MRKRVRVFVLMITLLAGGAAVASAKGAPNVANTKHNMSTTGQQATYRTDSEQVCVFCHTPHGAKIDAGARPLWNRDDPGSAWQFYASDTLSLTASAVASVSTESLLCLSCHDGSLATNRVINPPNGLTGANAPQPTTQFGDSEIIGLPGVYNRIGGSPVDSNGVGDLRDDHPISFDYQLVLNGGEQDLHTVADAKVDGVRFFPLNSSTEFRVECSSCHDPHVDYTVATGDPQYTPFLIMSNTNSALCLACHNK